MTSDYEQKVRQKLKQISPLILVSHLDFYFDKDTGILFAKGSITFIDESTLEFTEKISFSGHRYRFHYMDKSKHLITR